MFRACRPVLVTSHSIWHDNHFCMFIFSLNAFTLVRFYCLLCMCVISFGDRSEYYWVSKQAPAEDVRLSANANHFSDIYHILAWEMKARWLFECAVPFRNDRCCCLFHVVYAIVFVLFNFAASATLRMSCAGNNWLHLRHSYFYFCFIFWCLSC